MSERDIRDYINSLNEENLNRQSGASAQAGDTLGWALLDAIASPVDQPPVIHSSSAVSTEAIPAVTSKPLQEAREPSSGIVPPVGVQAKPVSAAHTFGNIFKIKPAVDEVDLQPQGSLKALLKSIATCR
ncbi:hypothetical protein [Pseudomonas luteola]|uniref:hypothetical protein n=1 Tax=Pseudomonas luteola TaxID=47886 RepID=UPI001238B86D|nr:MULTISPECIES: hypothetical protein [Pseudomonas]MBA1246963.1 hypothetical protein [Pseudomonas zeshuii]QEU28404.1 hypothetical protein FOB45_11640 [Pseudomonas luteola]